MMKKEKKIRGLLMSEDDLRIAILKELEISILLKKYNADEGCGEKIH